METTKNKCYPNTQQGIGILVLFIFLSMIFGLITTIGEVANTPIIRDIALLVSYTLAAGATLIIIVRMKKTQNPDIPVFMNYSPGIKTTLITLIMTLALIIGIEPLTNLIPIPDSVKNLFETMFRPTLPAFFTAVIAAPVIEELIFRGIILEGFLRNYSPLKSILLVSVLFGLAHLNPWQFIGAFIIGVFIGWIYWKTRSLVLSIGVHMLNNLISYLAMQFSSESPVDTTINDFIGNVQLYYVLIGVSIVILILGIYFHKKWIRNRADISLES